MNPIEQQIIEGFRILPLEKQQEILDFVEFLKMRFLAHPDESEEPISALEAAGDLVGCVEGPEDLSTNKKYMEGFGQ